MSTDRHVWSEEDEKNRVIDYFAVCGLPSQLTERKRQVSSGNEETEKEQSERGEDLFLLKTMRQDGSLEPQVWHGHQSAQQKDPIVDVSVINKSLNETVPPGYECIWLTPSQHSANLCGEGLLRQNQQMFLVFKRGTDRLPITDIGVYYEGAKEQVMSDCVVVKQTYCGLNSANLNTSSFLNTERIFITFRRSNQLACNSLAVVDIGIILKVTFTFNK